MSASEHAGTIYSLDNVPLDLPIAGVGSRILAGFIDYLVIGVLGLIWIIGATTLVIAQIAASRGTSLGLIGMALAILGLFLIEYGYFAGFEIGLGGRTPGKIALGLHVVTRLGAQPAWGLLLARNLVRTIDLAVGVPLMIFDPAARRLGDRLAGTLVVYQDPPVKDSETLARRVPSGWGAPEVALAESFLLRSRELDRDRAAQIAELLLRAIERDEPRLLDGVRMVIDPVLRLHRALETRPTT
jgi:uncharacterized RDD family membrane protein YckC